MDEVRGSRVAGTLVAAQRVTAAHSPSVMAALVAAIHDFACASKSWMAGIRPAMTPGAPPARTRGGAAATARGVRPTMTRGAALA